MDEYKEVSTGSYRRFLLEDEPLMLNIVPLNFQDQYVIFFHDAYGLEPWQTGLRVLTQEEIKEKFNIEL